MAQRVVPAVVVLVIALALGFVLTGSASERDPVVVVGGHQGEVAAVPLSGDSRFSLRYRHSVYERPAVETFAVDESGRFSLVHVTSSSEEVLDYYGIDGRRVSKGPWRRLVLDEPQRFSRLSLIGTPTGRRTLLVDDERVPLYGQHGPAHLSICIRPGPTTCWRD
ncbi:MAG: hypothetical protein ACRDK3_01765 [Actinomycetota bacterium]